MKLSKNRIKFMTVVVLIALILGLSQYQHVQYKKITSTKVMKYVVKEGDNVSCIAEKFKGKREFAYVLRDIEFVNGVKDDIVPGQELIIPLKNE